MLYRFMFRPGFFASAKRSSAPGQQLRPIITGSARSLKTPQWNQLSTTQLSELSRKYTLSSTTQETYSGSKVIRLQIYSQTFLLVDDQAFRYICRFELVTKEAALLDGTFVDWLWMSLLSTVLCNIIFIFIIIHRANSRLRQGIQRFHGCRELLKIKKKTGSELIIKKEFQMVMVRKDFYNIKSEMDRQHPCQICDMPYSISEKSCPFCDSPSKICSSKRNLSKIQCPKCSFENDLSNPVCVACDASFDPDQDKKVPCDHCGMQVLKRLIDQHSTNCMLSMELIKQAQKEEAAMKELLNYQLTEIECKYCHVKIPGDLIEDHNEVCVSKPKPKPVPLVVSKPVKIPPPKKPDYGSISSKHFKPGNKLEPAVMEPYEPIEIPAQIKQNELFSEAELARLTKLQKDAILYMHARSLKQHTAAQKALQQRTKKLGFKKEDLENLLFYIENHAPIIIHIHILKHMEFFIKDTHYRSQFETNKSSGSLSRQSRTQWENRMFDKHYAKATDFERVKYGVINFTNDPKGVNCALGYGLSYFLLKQHVRNRCTMTDMDSSSATSLIGTFKYCFHILNKTNDQQLKSAFNAAKALEQSSSVTTTYKEIQIHGPIEFAKDIERIYVNRKEVQDKKYLDMVYAFCERNKVEMEFI